MIRYIATVVGGGALMFMAMHDLETSPRKYNAGVCVRGNVVSDLKPQTALATTGEPLTALYFSPATDMDRVDIPLILGARQTLDIAMYTFTDVRIAEALVTAAQHGVRIRLYRDRDQFDVEQRRGGRVMAILAHQPGVQIRVKGSSELMHDKAFLVDGTILRDGSGNWSVSAAKYQDNEVSTTTESSECAEFASAFDAMWGRTDNEVVQGSLFP